MATILVVDDRAVSRMFLAALLGYGGYASLRVTRARVSACGCHWRIRANDGFSK